MTRSFFARAFNRRWDKSGVVSGGGCDETSGHVLLRIRFKNAKSLDQWMPC